MTSSTATGTSGPSAPLDDDGEAGRDHVAVLVGHVRVGLELDRPEPVAEPQRLVGGGVARGVGVGRGVRSVVGRFLGRSSAGSASASSVAASSDVTAPPSVPVAVDAATSSAPRAAA